MCSRDLYIIPPQLIRSSARLQASNKMAAQGDDHDGPGMLESIIPKAKPEQHRETIEGDVSFTTLPPEIRNQIYILVLAHDPKGLLELRYPAEKHGTR